MHTLTVDIVAISYSGNKFHILQISYSLKSFEDNVSWNFVTGFTKTNLIVTSVLYIQKCQFETL